MGEWLRKLLIKLLILQLAGRCLAIESGDGEHGQSFELEGALSEEGWVKSDSGDFVKIPNPGELFEGDIIMSKALRDAVLFRDKKRTALKDTDYLWPDAHLPFILADDMPNEIVDSIAKAIAHIHLETCVRLEPRHDEEDYIKFDWRKNACSSAVGRQGGEQTINIGENCLVFGHVIHEIMHALGFIHEHSRPDRDDYIKIFYDNIKAGQVSNFQKYSFADVDRLDMKYNFDSVMQYPNDAFTRNGKPTILSIMNPFRVFGQRTHFDQGDIDQINRLYKCNEKSNEQNRKPSIAVAYKDQLPVKPAGWQ